MKIYDEDYRLTDEGLKFYQEMNNLLRVLYKKYYDQGFNLRDIQTMLVECSVDICNESILSIIIRNKLGE